MKLWNFFSQFASSSEGDVINKVNDQTYMGTDGTVFRRQGSVITGSDGSIINLLDAGSDVDRTSPRMGVQTFDGYNNDGNW